MTDTQPPADASLHRPLNRKNLLMGSLLAVAAAVVLVLPNYVTEPWIASDQPATAPLTSDGGQLATLNPSQIAENKQYRRDAQVLLAEIIQTRSNLEQRGAGEWARFALETAQINIQRGDDAYLNTSYSKATERYTEALEQLKELYNSADTALASSLKKASESLKNGDIEAAIGAANSALLIAPDNIEAQRLSARASVLPDVIEQLQEADKALNAGQLERAITAYRRALKSDAEHLGAQRALRKTQTAKRERDFTAQMSLAWQALDSNQFSLAKQAFERATAIDANNPALDQGRSQLATRQADHRSSQQLVSALRLERQEAWQKALYLYDQMLVEDSSLTEPRVRRVNAAVRATLDRQVRALLAAPLELSNAATYRRSRQLLGDLDGLVNGDDTPKLRDQIARLKTALQRSQTATDVEFRSDGLTNVTLYRVSKLGTFTAQRLQLKPGRYRASGARNGYRDVLVEFIIDGQAVNPPIDIRCSELI